MRTGRRLIAGRRSFAQPEYSFSPKTFTIGAGRYEQDEFSGFEYQATASAGLGRHFIDNATTKFSGAAGLGYKFFETRDAFDEDTGVLLEEETDTLTTVDVVYEMK